MMMLKDCEVEVCSEEDGFEGAWFKAVLEENPTKSGRKKIRVRYLTLLNEDGSSLLTENIDQSFIRPVPPVEEYNDIVLEEGVVVDADHKDGWWTGVVIKEMKQDKVLVYFDSPSDIIEFDKQQLRAHIHWTGWKWERPNIRILSKSEYCPGTIVEVSSVINKVETTWVPAMIIKEIEEDGEKMFHVKECNKYLKCNGEDARSNKNVDPRRIRPVPPASSVAEFKLLESVEAFCGSSWRQGLVRAILTEKRYMVSVGTTMEDFKHADLRPLMVWKDGVWGKESTKDRNKSSDIETTYFLKKKRKSRGTDKSLATTRKTKKKKITDYLPFLQELTVQPTRYIDHDTLERLGIWEDVEKVFGFMGLAQFITIEHPTYEDLTRQFLATVEIKYSDNNLLKPEDGCITFRVDDVEHTVTFPTLCSLFGFHGADSVIKNDLKFSKLEVPSKLWDMVGNGDFKPGVSKASRIRSPVFRYAQKVLANTFFARKETCAVKKGEYYLLMEAVSEFLWEIDESSLQSRSSPNLGAILAKELVAYKSWAHNVWEEKEKKDKNKKKTSPTISIGGIITHILKYCEVNLDAHPTVGGNLKIDGPYLQHCGFLAGISDKGLLVYQFRTKENTKAFVELPNQKLTSMASRENIFFSLPVELQYLGKRSPIKKSQWPNMNTKDNEAGHEQGSGTPPEIEISRALHGNEGFALLAQERKKLEQREKEVEQREKNLAQQEKELAQKLKELAAQKQKKNVKM